MGFYINPKDGSSKEDWLKKNGSLLVFGPSEFSWKDDVEFLPVCLVDNGPFTAAGIAFNEREFQAFNRPDDRPKEWYKVKKELLKEFLPEG